MINFSIGLSGVNASQRALDVIGQNIANANTPGYHRQVARLVSRKPQELLGLSFGLGVEVSHIARLRNGVIEAALLQERFGLGNTTTQLDTLRRVETLIYEGEGSLQTLFEEFFNRIEELTARPDELAQRRVVLTSASALSNRFNEVASSLLRVREQLDSEIGQVVDELNPMASEIAELNRQIARSELRGVQANTLRDQRDQLIQEMAGLVDLQAIEQDNGVVTVLVGGTLFAGSRSSSQLESGVDAQNNAVVTLQGSTVPIVISGGKLGGLLQVRNQLLPNYQNELEQLARELIRGFDGVQATGLGLSGPLSFLSGHRSVSDVAVPLSQAGLDFPPQNGSLFVTVTDLNTGAQTLTELAIAPDTMSLQDVATAISTISNVQAVADAQTGTLQILVQSGYGVDFAGRLEPSPDTSGITGTTVPQIGGVYTGAGNDTFTFDVVGSGTVGVTPGLTLEVRNSAATLLTSLNIGQGYEPGAALQVADGVTVSLSSGTANAADTFSTRVVAQPDTAGILTALGLNTFFAGTTASDIQVQPDLLQDPDRLASSRSGQPSDGSNLRRMAALRDTPLVANGTLTLAEAYLAIVSEIGGQVRDLNQLQTSQELSLQHLEAQQQSVSGVDPNEELVHLAQFQRQFEIAARYISVMNDVLAELVQII